MIPLLLTTAYLCVMSVMVSSDVLDTRMLYSERNLYFAARDKIQDEKRQEVTILHESSRSPSVTEGTLPIDSDEQISVEQTTESLLQKPPYLNFDHKRPPNNAKINFYDLLFSYNPDQTKGEYSLYEQTAALLRLLYQNILPAGAEYQLLNALILKKEETKAFLFPDELATLTFEEENIQNLFHQLLKGSQEYPSLLFFITFDKHTTRVTKKINLLFTSREILLSFFPVSLVDSLLDDRATLWNAIEEQQRLQQLLPKEEHLTRSKISQITKAFFMEALKRHSLDDSALDFFEFTLGKKGSILLTEDFLTHQKERKKILKRVDHR